MTVVVDASVATAWCLRDEAVRSREADVVMEGPAVESRIVPGIFWHEMRNAFLMAERRGRIVPEEVEEHMAALRAARLVTDDEQDDGKTVEMARRHTLTAYDAAYLETAQRHAAAVATFDRKMAVAARAEGIPNGTG